MAPECLCYCADLLDQAMICEPCLTLEDHEQFWAEQEQAGWFETLAAQLDECVSL